MFAIIQQMKKSITSIYNKKPDFVLIFLVMSSSTVPEIIYLIILHQKIHLLITLQPIQGYKRVIEINSFMAI